MANKIMWSTELLIESLYLKGNVSPYHHIKYCYNLVFLVDNEETDEAEQAQFVTFTIL